MAEWIYRASEAKADLDTTMNLLEKHGFLSRSAYNKKQALIANVQRVQPGDLVHIIFSRPHRGVAIYEGIGSFQVLGDPHPDHGGWVRTNDGEQLALFRVRLDSPLDEDLKKTKYGRDPLLGEYTGWHLRDVQPREIDFTGDLFSGQGTIRKMPVAPMAGAPETTVLDTDEPEPAVAILPTQDLPLPPPPPATRPGEKIRFPTGRALGLDWSGSAGAGGKVWAAVVEFAGPGAARLVSVERPFFVPALNAAGVVAAFPGWLETQAFDVAGLDFCFGLARDHDLPGWPRTGPAALGQWLADHYPTPDAFRAAIGPERKRATDRHRGAPFAPTNLRMYKQTFWGLRALAGVTLPIPPWDRPAARAVVEVLPAHVAAAICPDCRYKGRGPQERDGREWLLRAIEAACGLAVGPSDRDVIIGNPEGDALDAVLAAVAAAAALAAGFPGPAEDAAASGEGWIYSVD